jgi:hypothetical protein
MCNDFEAFPKIPRLRRDCVITEKIDGTNAQIMIELADAAPTLDWTAHGIPFLRAENDGLEYVILAGSRSRWISEKDDNFGFAKWVSGNRDDLLTLGPGRHFGEWWGSGIQRGYGLKEKRFSLFNTSRWNDETKPACCHVVPILYHGPFTTNAVESAAYDLEVDGSSAAPGFMKPEGLIVYHEALRGGFKLTLEKDEEPKTKWQKEAA